MLRRRLNFEDSAPLYLPHPAKLRHVSTLGFHDLSAAFDNISMKDVMSLDDVEQETICSENPDSTQRMDAEESSDSGIDSPDSQLEDMMTIKQSDRRHLCNSPAQGIVQHNQLKRIVEQMDRESGLIGDGTRNHRLPVIEGRHKDFKSISTTTVRMLLAGRYDDAISGFTIVDCRYPYEYNGGHIEGAINIHTEEQVMQLITERSGEHQNHILIFHCEFSSERGPKLLRHLRRLDRKLNSEHYPSLHYPEVYILDGGYKAFFEQYKESCEPMSYLPMVHESFSSQLRHFRVKSKSWTAGEKQGMRRRKFDISPIKYNMIS